MEGRASNTSSPTPPTHYIQFVFGSPKTKQSGEITSMIRPLKGETENITLTQVTWPVFCRVRRTSKRTGGGNKAIKRQRRWPWQRTFLKSTQPTTLPNGNPAFHRCRPIRSVYYEINWVTIKLAFQLSSVFWLKSIAYCRFPLWNSLHKLSYYNLQR